MYKNNRNNERDKILRVISRHPNAKFAKLFYEVDEAPSQKNIVLLLMELTQQRELYVDFNVSLQYFLNLYEKLDAANKEFLFNEAGLLIRNATEVYSKRVDCIQQRVEDQLAELSSGQESGEKNETEETPPELEILKRPRKRVVEATTDLYDVELAPRKFRKLSKEKRFAECSLLDKSKTMCSYLHVESDTHPSLWQHAEIVDLENHDESDFKRNYRLFTSHIEHRYNTLVPDINFGLFYKIKDFIDEEDEREESETNQKSEWPPLSQAFVKRYIELEDRVLGVEMPHSKRQRLSCSLNLEDRNKDKEKNCSTGSNDQSQLGDSGIGSSLLQTSSDSIIEQRPSLNSTELDMADAERSISNKELSQESGIGLEECSMQTVENSMNFSQNVKSTIDTSANSIDIIQSDEKNSNSELNKPPGISMGEEKENPTSTEEHPEKSTENKENKLKESNQENVDEEVAKCLELSIQKDLKFSERTVTSGQCASLSPRSDEGVYFSDLDDLPLTPETYKLDAKALNVYEEKRIKMSTPETFKFPDNKQIGKEWPIELNILEFSKEVLNKMRRRVLLTSLGEDMELFLRARLYKRSRGPPEETKSPKRTFKPFEGFQSISSTDSDGYISPPPSPGTNTVLLGFCQSQCVLEQLDDPEELGINILPSRKPDFNHRLSRDSGVSTDLISTTEKNTRLSPLVIGEEKVDFLEEDIKPNIESENKQTRVEILDNLLLNPGDIKSDQSNASNEAVNTLSNSQQPQNFEKDSRDECNVISEDITAGVDGAISEIINTEVNRGNSFAKENINDKSDTSLELNDQTTEKIRNWHRHLQPILAHSRERHHFDVFQIGTDILNKFDVNQKKPSDESNSPSITFQDVMHEKDPSYVSRFFLSSLLLINQGNIGITIKNKSYDKPSEWSDIHLNLLSTKRHVVSVEDNIGKANPPQTQIKMVRPIQKAPRESVDYDSGIFSTEDNFS